MTDVKIFLRPAAGPILQVILATFPIFALLVYFLFIAHERLDDLCSKDPQYWNINDDQKLAEEVDRCNQQYSLRDILIVYLCFGLAASIAAGYLSYYVPRRHDLVDRYLNTGLFVGGDVFYKGKGKTGTCCAGETRDSGSCCGSCQPWNHYGTLTYVHPYSDRLPVYLRREVRIFELYTRESISVLVLPNKPFSGQPKLDLEVDQDVFRRNERKFEMMKNFMWFWVAFTLISPIYILVVMIQIDDKQDFKDWQVDREVDQAIAIYAAAVFVIIPVIAYGINWVAWRRHERWMTQAHKILEESERLRGFMSLSSDEESTASGSGYRAPTIGRSWTEAYTTTGTMLAADSDDDDLQQRPASTLNIVPSTEMTPTREAGSDENAGMMAGQTHLAADERSMATHTTITTTMTTFSRNGITTTTIQAPASLGSVASSVRGSRSRGITAASSTRGSVRSMINSIRTNKSKSSNSVSLQSESGLASI